MKKGQSGITLVALVITIIVMLILTMVTVTIALDENGIIGKALKARDDTNNAAGQENKIKDGIITYNNVEMSINNIVF